MLEFFPGNYRWSYNTMLAFAAGGQIGDIGRILPALQAGAGDDEVWHAQWSDLAKTAEDRLSQCLSPYSQSDTLLLACLYHIMAEHFVPPADPRRMRAYEEVLRLFDRARQSAGIGMESVSIPFEGAALPAYFLPGQGSAAAKPTAIFICSLDTTKELWFLRARQQFALRGINCLFVDTPGIGGALRLHKLYTRHDYEVPVGAAIDYLATRPDVDSKRIGIVGSSLGGYYIARAAAFEKRLKVAIAWGGVYDYYKVWQKRLTSNAVLGAPKFQIMYVTGKPTIEEAVEAVSQFRLPLFADKIVCPFLIMHGADDRQVPLSDAESMLAAIASPKKELKVFDGRNGGDAHTQFDNHLPALHFAADWMSVQLSS